MAETILTERQKRGARHVVASHDVPDLDQIRKLMYQLAGTGVTHKVGLRAMTRGQIFEVLSMATELGEQVIVDTKLFDVPDTCTDAVGHPDKLGVDLAAFFAFKSFAGAMVSTFSGPPTMTALAERFKGQRAKLIGVGWLTSNGPEDFMRMDSRYATIEEAQLHQLRLAHECGLRNFVCAGTELAYLLEHLGHDDVDYLVPGVRMPGEPSGKQKRIVTPAEAVAHRPSRVRVVIGSGLCKKLGQTPGPREQLGVYGDHIADALEAASLVDAF